MKPVRTLLPALLLAVLLAACGREPSAPAPLAYAPADTAYVFANLEAMPEEVVDLWRELLAPLDRAFRNSLGELRAAHAPGPEAGDGDRARLWAILELLEDKLSVEGWENIGIHADALWALYGIDLVPVLRLEVAAPERLRAFIAELEQRAGKPFPVARLGEQEYWHFPLPGKKPDGAIVMALVDRHLVLTADLADDPSSLGRLLGLEAPARSLLDSGELLAVNREYGFSPHGTAVFDLRRVMAQLLGGDGRDTWFSQLLAREGEPLGAECRSEFQALVEKTPRLVSGYTRLDRQRQESVGILEMDAQLRQSLSGLAAPVPGLGQTRTGMEIGLGINLDRLAGFLQAQARAIKESPFTCKHLLGLNAAADSTATASAGLYGASGLISGLRIHLQRLTLADSGMPDQVEGTLILASPSPAALLGMAHSFMPPLAQLELVPGDEPVPLDMEGIPGADALPRAWAALGNSALGVAVGEDSHQGLVQDLAAAGPDPAPLLYMGYQGSFYAELMRQVRLQEPRGPTPSDAPADSPPGPDTDGDKMSRDDFELFLAPVLSALDEIYTAFAHVAMDLVVTDRGLEMRQTMVLD